VRGRQILLFRLDDKISLIKEINLPVDDCFEMVFNQSYICAACDDCYLIVNINNSSIQKLFHYDIETINPYIANHIEVTIGNTEIK
jgi:hypothetical protein